MPGLSSAIRYACLILLPALMGNPSTVRASEPVSREALIGLARQLVESADYNFGRADDYLDKVQGRENFKAIPDGEVLLLQVGIGGRGGPKLEQPLLAIKSGDDVLVSLFDFASVAQFAIDVKAPEKIAEGWYIRENKKFRLDANTMTITADGNVYELAEGDVEVDDSDILVRSAVLAKVFEFQGNISLRYQRINVSTAQKWPVLEKLERMKKKGREYQPPPSLPRQDEPYKLVSVPNVDVASTYSYERAGDNGEIVRARSHTLVATGDMLGHTLRANVAGDDIHAVNTVRATLQKESDKPDLLGGLKAREYEFGDITAVSVAGVPSVRRGTGFRATNRNPYVTSEATTEIEGDITPGWDVELYRDTQFLDVITSSDGEYRFEDVRLSGGENKFRIVKYGPLGEVEESEFIIYSTPREFAEERDLYEFSVSAAETDVWTRQTSHDQDKYTPIIAGNYERQLSMDTTVNTGLFTSQVDGEQKSYLNTGLATYVGNTIVNADLTADLNGSYLTTATARRMLWGQNITAELGYTADDYGALDGFSIPSEYTWGLGSRGALPSIFDYSLGNYAVSTEYKEDDEGRSQQSSKFSWSKRIMGLTVNNSLDHELRDAPDVDAVETLDGRASVSGTLGRTRWRTSAAYTVDPEWNVDTYQLDLSRRLGEELTGRLAINNTPDTDFTEGTATLVWNNKHITVAPGVSYNTNNDFSAFVSANFGLSYDPYSRTVAMDSDKLTDSGGISAFVYLDKDGDLTFSDGDEPIQDAVVEAVHSSRKGATDESGQAFIHDIPNNLLTDVKVDEYSFFDPFMVAGTQGVSILPRSGHTARIEFPVHNGGEIDGTIYVNMKDGKDRTAKNLRVHLYDIHGNLVQATPISFDGFYLFQKIHPGQYWLMVDGKDARNNNLVRPLPELLTFGYEGTLMYGHQVFVRKANQDEIDTPLTIGEDYAEYIELNPGVDVEKIKNSKLVINFGDYHSRAMMGVVWYKLKMVYGSLIRGAELVLPISQSNPSVKTGLHSLRAVIPGLTMQEAYTRCYNLTMRGVDCKVEMLPTGLDKKPDETKQASL